MFLSSYAARSAEQNDAVAALPAQAVVIIEDQETKAFRFMIDGQEIARLDATGLRVRESVEYGGTLTDTGTAHFDKQVGREGKQD